MSDWREGCIVPVLADVVNYEATIDALHPRAGRAVVEHAGVPAVVSEGTATIGALEAATELANCGAALAGRGLLGLRQQLDVDVRHIGFVPSRGERSPIAMSEAAGLEDLNHFEVPRAQDFRTEVLLGRQQEGDWRSDTGRTNQLRRT